MSERPDLRAVARDIFARTIAEIDVERVVKNYVRLEDDWLIIGDERLDLRSVARLIVIGIGKACLPMGRALESILGDRLTAGLLATNAVVGEMPQRLPVFLGGHPVPNAASLEAAETAIELLRAVRFQPTARLSPPRDAGAQYSSRRSPRHTRRGRD